MPNGGAYTRWSQAGASCSLSNVSQRDKLQCVGLQCMQAVERCSGPTDAQAVADLVVATIGEQYQAISLPLKVMGKLSEASYLQVRNLLGNAYDYQENV